MKNTEWLKEEVEKDIHHVFAEGDIYYVSREHILGLIDQLDMPEVLSKKWIGENTYHNHYVGSKGFVYADDLQNLLVPKQELPVIPQWVADNIESKKRVGTRLNVAMSEFPEFKLEKELDIDEHECNEIYARAWLDGYTAEEEQKYEVRCKGELLLTYYTNIGEVVSMNRWDNHLSKKAGRDWKLRHKLTEQEIKDYDERYWAFAVPVGEME